MAPSPEEQSLAARTKDSPSNPDDCPRTPLQPQRDDVSIPVEFTPRQNVMDFALSNLERGEHGATPNRPRHVNRQTLIVEEAQTSNTTSRKILAANGGELPRLILRNMPFDQSSNKVHIQIGRAHV